MAERDDETIQTQVPQTGDREVAVAAAGADPVRRPPPQTLGRYRIRRLLGRGGVGAVYEADDPELGRRVAIKVLRDDRVGDTEALKHEAQALARLVHPNVVTVHDVGIADGEVYVVMQLVDGYPIDEWLAARAATPAQILAAYRQAGEGLAAAHAAQLVHCDFKPGNILVDKQGVVRVTDFGLARGHRSPPADAESAAASGILTIAGTPAYMAPEQFAGDVVAASDQFAFCVALWEALAGQRPFDDPSIAMPDPARVRARPLRTDASASRIPADLMPILERGLAPVPEARYPAMRELLAALEPRRRVRPAWVLVGAGAVVAAGAAVAVVIAMQGPAPARQAAIPVPPVAPAWAGADAANTHALTSYGSAACAYSPMVIGDQVVFDRTLRGAVDLFEVALAGGEPHPLTSGPRWEWRAQAGRRPGEVVHLIHDPDHDQKDARIAYLDLATGAETPALTVLAWDAVVVGGALYYSPDQAKGIRRLTGPRNEEFAQPPAGRDFFLIAGSPTGDQLALTSSYSTDGLCLVDIASRKTRCLDTRSSAARPAFGADGRALYFNGADGIIRRDLATGVEDVIAHGLWTEGGLAVVRDGSALLYSACTSHSTVIDLVTGAIVLPDATAQFPTFGPGGELAWTREVRGVDVIVVRARDGHEVEVTSNAVGSVAGPAFSADGHGVAFVGSGKHAGIFYARVDEPGALHQLTESPHDSGATWTDAGDVAFTRTNDVGDFHAYLVTVDGNERQLGSGSRTVYATRHADLLVGTSDKLFWLDPRTRVERPGPAKPPGSLLWASISPNGKWVMYQMGQLGREVWRARLEPARAPEFVTQFDASITTSPGAITDDGHPIIAAASWYGDLYVIPARPGAKF